MLTAQISIPAQVVTDTNFSKEFPKLEGTVLILSKTDYDPDEEDCGMQANLQVSGSFSLDDGSILEIKEIALFRDSTNNAQLQTPFFSDTLTFESVSLKY